MSTGLPHGAAQILWTSHEAIAATGGICAGEWQATGISIDSRSIAAKDLFVALKGPHHDGHDYVEGALKQGAVAAMVHKKPKNAPLGASLLTVRDTMVALRSLGAAARERTSAKIIAITGSVGKTGVKEALKVVLAQQAQTHASVGSFNNHWGVPLSLARMPKNAAFGVFEIGMNHPGEIEPLAGLIRPHVAIITTVEAVHSEFFSTTEQIADAKAEIFSGVESDAELGGIAVLNRDNPYFDHLSAAARRKGVDEIIGFGEDKSAEVRLLDVALEHDKSIVMAEVYGRPVTYRIGIAGRHWVMNSLCVLAGVHAVGADVEAAAAAFADLHPAKGRGQVHHVALPDGGGDPGRDVTVIDESYNASPVSMKAALAVLGQQQPAAGGRRIAVLGDMLELGPLAATKHKCLLTVIQENDIDLVFTAGSEMANLAEALPRPISGGHAASSEKLADLVVDAIRPGDVVTVKGSAGSRMNVIVAALIDFAKSRAGQPTQRVVNGE